MEWNLTAELGRDLHLVGHVTGRDRVRLVVPILRFVLERDLLSAAFVLSHHHEDTLNRYLIEFHTSPGMESAKERLRPLVSQPAMPITRMLDHIYQRELAEYAFGIRVGAVVFLPIPGQHLPLLG